MAKTKQWQPQRVRSEDERSGGKSDYLRLDEGQRFTGYALFEGDPAVDEPGYYEYLEHFDVNARRSVPCAGEDCPLCEDGDKPKTRAKTLWLVTKDEKGNDLGEGELKIFQINWNVIKIFTDMRSEGDKIKGVMFRVSRIDDRGNYNLLPKNDKLTSAKVKELVKGKDVPDFDSMVTATLNRAMEGYSVRKALDDDNDDDEPESTPSKKSAKKDEPEPADSEWPDEGEDETVTVGEVDDGNTITVTSDEYEDEAMIWGTGEVDFTELEAGQQIVVSWETDEEGDKVASAFEEAEAEAEAEAETGDDEDAVDLPDTIEGEEFVVVGEVDEENGSIPVKSDELELEFLLYVLEGVEIDWEDYPEGTKVVVSAEKDAGGDMVSTEAPEIVKDTKTTKKGSTKKSGGKSSSKSKSTAKKKSTTKKAGKKSK